MRGRFFRLSLGASMAPFLLGCSHLTGLAAVPSEILGLADGKECRVVAGLLREEPFYKGIESGSNNAVEDRVFSIEEQLETRGSRYHCDITKFTVSAHAEGSFRPVYEAPITNPGDRLKEEEKHFKQVIENMMLFYNEKHLSRHAGKNAAGASEPFRILVFAHGGLVSHDNSIRRAQMLAPAMIADGFYPVFVTWNSPFPQAYFQRLCCLSDGSASTALSTVMLPFRLVGDIGSGVARIPENTIEQSGRFLSSSQAEQIPDRQERVNGDIDQASSIDRNAWLAEEQYRIWPTRPVEPDLRYRCTPFLLRSDLAVSDNAPSARGPLARRSCPNVVLPPYRRTVGETADPLAQRAQELDDLNGRRTELGPRLGNIAMVPVRTVVSGVSGAGASAWDGMVRRARLGFSREFVVHYKTESPAKPAGNQETENKSSDERKEIKDPQVKCREDLVREVSGGSSDSGNDAPVNDSSYFRDSTPGAQYRFFERLAHCIRIDAFGQNVEVYVFGHSMGAIVANELIDKVRSLPYKNVVYMGGAASIRDTAATVNILRQRYGKNTENGPRFYNLMLHPISESIETSEGLTWQSLTPRGSLLEWIDEMFEGPRDVSERTIGKWRNVREGSQVFRARSMEPGLDLMRMRVFPVVPVGRGIEYSNFLHCWPYGPEARLGSEQPKKCTPERHGEFTDYSFWRPPFYTGDPPTDLVATGAWTVNRNFAPRPAEQ